VTAFEMRASSSGDFLSRSRTISPLYSLSLSYRRPPVKRAEKVTEGSSPFMESAVAMSLAVICCRMSRVMCASFSSWRMRLATSSSVTSAQGGCFLF